MAHSDSHQTSVPDEQIPETEEVILVNTDFENVSKKNKDLNFVTDWLDTNATVQSEIWRGQKLREEKPRPHKTENEYVVPNSNIFGPFNNQRRVRKRHLNSKHRTSFCSSRSRTSCRRAASPTSIYSTMNKISRSLQTKTRISSQKDDKRCPLRIAKLAVPTKRQCIETWRQKSDVLPDVMVERLKKYVLDQTPIVKIPEAIDCFQGGRSASSKKRLSSKIKGNEAPQPHRQTATRMFCILFAHKIAQRLSNPFNHLTLNSHFEKISGIVSSDIKKIMPQRQCTFRNNRQYEAIHTDISNQIAIWIAGILEDTSLKLLEEELRVKMETEAQIETMLQFSEQFYTIVEAIMQQENKILSDPLINSKDLEEEEGPVLDFIDDLVDNVLNISEPLQLQFDSEPDSPNSSKDVLLEEKLEQASTSILSSDHKMSNLEQILNTEVESQSIESLTNSDYFRNEIDNIISNITKVPENDIDSEGILPKEEIEHDINDEHVEDDLPKAEMVHVINDGNIEDDLPTVEVIHNIKDENVEDDSPKAEVIHDINDGNIIENPPQAEIIHDINVGNIEETTPEAAIEHDTNEANSEEIDYNSSNVKKTYEANDISEKTDSNVSERFEIFSDDSDDGMNTKNIMLFKNDLVNPINSAGKIITSTSEGPQSNESLQSQNNKHSITFAEPNQHLLSNADESWPRETPVLKISDIVCKSISSLGNITEYDENEISSSEEEPKVAGKGDTKLQVNDSMELLNNMLPTEKHDAANQCNEPPNKASTKTNNSEEKTRPTQVNLKTYNDDVPGEESSKLVNQTDSRENNHIRTESTADKTEDDVRKPSPKTKSKISFGWKVHPQTAPSWVPSWGHGRGEPSEDSSIKIQKSPIKVPEYELRKWCQELETAFMNLEIWSNWISTTCKDSLNMMRQTGLAQNGAIYRIRHKRDVRKDALLWTKLYQRTENNFKRLKRKYNNIEYSSNKSTSLLNETIFDLVCEFENQSVELHKMIVAAEYCAVCTCDKTKTRHT